MIRVTWQPQDGSFRTETWEEGCSVPTGYSDLIKSVYLNGDDLVRYWNQYVDRGWPIPSRCDKHKYEPDWEKGFELCGDWARMFLCNWQGPMPRVGVTHKAEVNK